MKKLLCVILSVSFTAFCFAVPSYAVNGAVQAPEQSAGASPIIVVSGMGNSEFPMTLDAGAENERIVYPPEDIDVMPIVWKVLPGLLLTFLTWDWNRLADRLIPVINDIFGSIACDENGDSKYDITVDKFTGSLDNYDYEKYFGNAGSSERAVTRSAIERYGADRTYFYYYNWRLDPIGHAAELNDLVQTAKSDHGCDKVVLVPCSMGGAQVMAYLAEYGSDDIDAVFFLSSVFYGSFVASDVFAGRVAVDKASLLLNIESDSAFTSFLIKAADKLKIIDGLLKIANNAIDKMKDKLYSECLSGIFGTMPGLWALVQPEDYELAKTVLLDPVKNAALIERIDYFHDNVSSKRDTVLKEAEAAGVRFGVFSHYGRVNVPVYPRANTQTDGTVEAYCTSGKAFFAPVGEKLPGGYIQKNTACGHNHLSPDGIIDASTCVFPEYTWFFKNVGHVGVGYGGEQSDFLFRLIEFDGQPTVHSDGLYTQFLENAGGGRLQVCGE